MENTRAAKTISLLWFGSILTAGCVFLIQVILAHNLEPDDFGTFYSALATISLLISLAGFGVSQYWLKVFGKEGRPAVRWLSSSFRFTGISTVVVILLLVIWAVFGPHDSLMTTILLILAVCILGQIVTDFVNTKLQLEERYIAFFILQLLPQLMRLLWVAIFIYVASTITIQLAASFYAAISLIFFIVGIYLLFRMHKGIFLPKGHYVIEHPPHLSSLNKPGIFQVAVQSWPFGMARLFYLIYLQSDIILLKYMAGGEVAGIYNVAFSVMAAIFLLPNVVQTFLLPKMHRWANHDRDKFDQVYQQGPLVMFAIGIIAMALIWVLAPWGIPFLFGNPYKPAVEILFILAISAPIFFVASSIEVTLVTQDNIKKKVKIIGAAAVINVCLNIAFIPIYGAVGAAVATVFCNSFLLLFYYLESLKVSK